MKVTLIERQDFEGNQLKQSIERVLYPKDMKELSHIAMGYRAKRIRLECEFDVNEIPMLVDFIQDAKRCFTL